jgi:hypothetical protein
MRVLIIGNMVEGVSVTGPFRDANAATEYADNMVQGEPWVVADLDPAITPGVPELKLGEFRLNLTPNVGAYEAERWRAISDELLGQVQRLRHIAKTRAEWQAIEALDSASRHLFGAFGAVVREGRDANQEA